MTASFRHFPCVSYGSTRSNMEIENLKEEGKIAFEYWRLIVGGDIPSIHGHTWLCFNAVATRSSSETNEKFSLQPSISTNSRNREYLLENSADDDDS